MEGCEAVGGRRGVRKWRREGVWRDVRLVAGGGMEGCEAGGRRERGCETVGGGRGGYLSS